MLKLPANEYYSQDLKYISTFLPSVLNAMGVWPAMGERKSNRRRLLDRLVYLFSYSVILTNIVPASLFWLFKNKGNARACLRMSPFFMYALGTTVKYSILILGQDRIRRCWRYLEEDWGNVVSADTRSLMLESARTGRRLAAFSGWLYCSCGLCLRLIPLLYSGKIVDRYNVTVRLLPNPAYLFSLDTQATPVYEIMYTLQGAYGLVTVTIATGALGLIEVFTMHACGQLKILMLLMQEFIEEPRQKEVDKKLADIVEHQIRIRGFLQLVERTMRHISLTEISATTVLICVAGYFIITEWENNNSMVMIFYTISCSTGVINMFIFCYTGNRLILQAEEAALLCCELEWYRLPDRKARQMVLLMIMSNKPVSITAGKFVDVSLKTFGDIIRTAMAYLNMLRSVTG